MADDSKTYAWLDELSVKVGDGRSPKETAEAVAAVAQYAKVAIGLWRMLPGGCVDGVNVTRVVVKVAPRSPAKVMLVVQGTKGKKNVVTFHTGSAGAGLFHEFMTRAMAGSLQWREDTPYVEAAADETVKPLPGLGGP